MSDKNSDTGGIDMTSTNGVYTDGIELTSSTNTDKSGIELTSTNDTEKGGIDVTSDNGVDNLGVILEDEGVTPIDEDGTRRRSVLKHVKIPDGKVRSRNVSIQFSDTDEIKTVENGDDTKTELLYNISQSPPIYLTILFGFQQVLLSIVGSLIIPLLVADAACVSHGHPLVAKLVSTTMILNGITSLGQILLGVRLPLFQGPAAGYIVPLLSLNIMEPDRCKIAVVYADKYINGTATVSEDSLKEDLMYFRLQELMWPLVICGFIHFLFGFSGLVGFLMRYVGPITIVPTLMLIGLYVVKPTLPYLEVQWGIGALVWGLSLILTVYLGHKPMPIPLYSKEKGFHVIWYPLHQVLGLLIAIMVGWGLCGILTATEVFSDDPKVLSYRARTDIRNDVINQTPWVYFPYPGQFGSPLFSLSAFVGFLIATMTSILDSIGDYYACAGMCRVPPPPGHAVNRGIAVEGFCSMISGFMGAGFATTTYGGNIGAIGMTKVASRSVFVAMSIIYILLGFFSKISGVFVSIPYPVLGGAIVVIIGVFVGVNLSNLQVINLASTRNLSIIGTAIFVGFLVPTWMETNPKAIQTGDATADNILTIFLGNPNFIGSVLACFLDNTIPGTAEERGIAAWREDMTVESGTTVDYVEGPEVYDPLLPESVKSWRIMKYLPIFPYKSDSKQSQFDLERRPSFMPSLTPERRRSSVHAVRRESLGVGLYL